MRYLAPAVATTVATTVTSLVLMSNPLILANVIRIKGASASYALPTINKEPYKHFVIRYL